MTVQRSETGDAVGDAVRALRHGERESGGDSWGLAIPTDEGLAIETGLGRMPGNIDAVAAGYDATVALGHTRLATRGGVTLENAHPFAVRNTDGETVAALAHNGTWYGAPASERADSYYIARLVESFYTAGHDLERAVREAGDVTGETLLVLDREGTGYVHAGRFEITDTGGDIASSGGMPIAEGEVRVI
jgi:glutamine phosphoribosylpyrophosphate amidotransferase